MLGFESYRAPQDFEEDGIIHMPLAFDMPMEEWKRIKRADLVFEGVSHIGDSYEVRAFFNNKKAGHTTKHTAANGYAGRFVVFGHGNCFGAAGHCQSTHTVSRSALTHAAPQLKHPASPHRRLLTVTQAMTRVLKKYKNGLHTVTLVVTAKSPRRADRKPASGLFKCSRLSVQAYS